jgi:hypothetical protein
MKLELYRQIMGEKKTKISDFVELRPVGVELIHAGRQKERRTDGYDKANNRFSQFCKSA